jgi:hypothetical protein
MEYVSIQEIAAEWKMSKRRIQVLCREGRIPDAKMIGNMWALPKGLTKPFDARRKRPVYIEEKSSSLELRKNLKKLLKTMYYKAALIGIPGQEQRDYVLSSLIAGLMMRYVKEHEKAIKELDYMKMAYSEIGSGIFWDTSICLLQYAVDFIAKYQYDRELDCIVSWAYQYSNKLHAGTKYSNTQFFTEKYMIEYIISKIEKLEDAVKIVDPCCGGGNFLVECCEIICKKVSDDKIREYSLDLVSKLFGYDIDSGIAKIASVNIKIKIMSILYKRNQKVDLSLWRDIIPNIYVSASDSVGGAMEWEVGKNKVFRIGDGRKDDFLNVLGDADVIITNPPFATVKGMEEKLKNFLKDRYPLANCDTCAAFLLTISNLLKENGQCGMVTQNTWMHLKSFSHYRDAIFQKYKIRYIVNLGSGAFYDLSGEKANVSLIIMRCSRKAALKKEILYLDLSAKKMEEKVCSLNVEDNEYFLTPVVEDIDGTIGFDFSGSKELRELCSSMEQYSDIATPMQGTSTGNAKELIDFFWKHFGDPDWRLVSKGGGYSRWQGLNYCVVKWGTDGEYIKETKGSALRNVKHFSETKLVYSDTGTAGLNVRILLPEQIFVASGPGIRMKNGNPYAQLAYLNSRLATYYIRIFSPKLTIAAGYIGQLPVCEAIYHSVVLEKNSKLCIALKQKFLKTRPANIEYDDSYLNIYRGDLNKCAFEWFQYDLKNELLKLEIESQTDDYILEVFGISESEKEVIELTLGECAYKIRKEKLVDQKKLDLYLYRLLDAACVLKKTKVTKKGMGNDGILEYAAKDLQINPEYLVKFIVCNREYFEKVIEKYRDLILHNEILCLMGYHTRKGILESSKPVREIIQYMNQKYRMDFDIAEWIGKVFPEVHKEVFRNYPVVEVAENKCRKVERKC